jgi:endonuclease/exonuclease/phosphatase family metal-dependent hydrolase
MQIATKRNIVFLCVLFLCVVDGYFWFTKGKSDVHAHAVESNRQHEKGGVLLASQNETSCPYLFISWNLANFGTSKSQEALTVMARVLKDADVVAGQEVNAGKEFGARALADLASRMQDAKGVLFDYVVSDPTQPRNTETERYGYIVRKDTFSFSRKNAQLLREMEDVISREPFTLLGSLKKEEPVLFLSIHAVPTKKKPEVEVAHLLDSSTVRNAPRAIFSGDFNLPAKITDKTFKEMGYTGHVSSKTSLKNKLDGNGGYLLHQYDNIYTKGITVCEAGVIDFVSEYFSPVTNESLKKAKEVSDHLPVYIRFK